MSRWRLASRKTETALSKLPSDYSKFMEHLCLLIRIQALWPRMRAQGLSFGAWLRQSGVIEWSVSWLEVR